MWKFIISTFAILFFAFYELSGGADFERRTLASSTVTVTPLDVAQPSRPAQPDVRVTLASAPAPAAPQQADAPQEAPIILASADTGIRTDATFVTPELSTKSVAPENEAESALPEVDMRRVDASRVNMRTGPGTTFAVLTRLDRGDEVEILRDPGTGWVKLRVVASGRIGWMAERLLTADAG